MRTITDFRRIGKRKLKGRTPEEAKRIHDERARRNKKIVQWHDLYKRPCEALKLRYQHECVTVPLGNADLELNRKAREKYPQRKNWGEEILSRLPIPGGWKVREVSHGRYSSRCRYTRWSYHVEVRSCAWVRPNLIYFWFSNEKARKIKAPKGYFWSRDINGLKLVCKSSPEDDYHPTAWDLLNLTPRDIARVLRERATVRRAARAIQRKQEKEAREKQQKEMETILRAEKEGATVCLADSLRAGNCLAGTLNWATRHGFDRENHYTPSEVLKHANGDSSRVALVIAVALRRHRKEMDQGYAELSEHRA